MYLITWFNRETGQKSKLKVHTYRAAQMAVESLREGFHNTDVAMTYQRPNRIREIVITVVR